MYKIINLDRPTTIKFYDTPEKHFRNKNINIYNVE